MADPRAYMRVYRALADAIAAGEMMPGARLDMGLIADQHDVSREPVKHAMRLLARDGLVERYDGLGWYVR